MERGAQQATVHVAGYSPWGHKELDTTEQLSTAHVDICKVKVKVKSLRCVRLFATPWTVAYQAPLSLGFSRQQYWSGLPFPSPGDLPNPGIKPRSPALQTDGLLSEPPGKSQISVRIDMKLIIVSISWNGQNYGKPSLPALSIFIGLKFLKTT